MFQQMTSFDFRYKAFRDEEGEYTMFYWHLLGIRLGFVIIFEHFVFGICRVIDILVPDVPESLSLKMRRERYLAKQALADTEALMQVCVVPRFFSHKARIFLLVDLRTLLL